MVGVREKVCGGGTSELPSAQESVDTNKNTIQLIKDTGNAIPESYSTQRSPAKGATSRLAHHEKLSLHFLSSSFVIRVNLLHP